MTTYPATPVSDPCRTLPAALAVSVSEAHAAVGGGAAGMGGGAASASWARPPAARDLRASRREICVVATCASRRSGGAQICFRAS